MKKKITTIIITFAMFCVMSLSAFAAKSKFYIPANQVWTNAVAVTRTGSVNYVTVSLASVYPLEGTDNFHKIQARLVDYYGNVISDPGCVVLEEGKGDKQINLLNIHLSLCTVYLQFRGNSKAAAEAVIEYNGN